MIKDPELRKLAGLPADVPSLIREEKGLSTANIFLFLERLVRGGITEAKNDLPSAMTCLEALVERGYSAKELSFMRSYFEKVEAATEAQGSAIKAMESLRSQRWDKSEVY